MRHTGVASANLESIRRLGCSLVDSSLKGARVVGIRDHPIPQFRLWDTSRSRALATSDGDTMIQPATCAGQVMWAGAKIRFRGGLTKATLGVGKNPNIIADLETHDVTRLARLG